MKKFLKKNIFFLFFCLFPITSFADAWVLNAPIWSRSYAEAHVPGKDDVDDSGVVFGQSSATAGPLTNIGCPSSYAYAHAHSRGLWGGKIVEIARGPGASAGSKNPFIDTPSAVPGYGHLEFELNDFAVEGGNLNLSGYVNRNENGLLEISVLDISDLSESSVIDTISTYGSVESAIAAGILPRDKILFKHREFELGFMKGDFQFSVNIGSLKENNIAILGVGHTVSNENTCDLITLKEFDAFLKETFIQLSWITGTEINNFGYRIWRGIKDNSGNYTNITTLTELSSYQTDCTEGELTIASPESSQFILAAGNEREGACYSFADNTITQDGTYYYVLEDIDNEGKSTFHCNNLAAATIGQGLANPCLCRLSLTSGRHTRIGIQDLKMVIDCH
jgi:hypothetical protein